MREFVKSRLIIVNPNHNFFLKSNPYQNHCVWVFNVIIIYFSEKIKYSRFLENFESSKVRFPFFDIFTFIAIVHWKSLVFVPVKIPVKIPVKNFHFIHRVVFFFLHTTKLQRQSRFEFSKFRHLIIRPVYVFTYLYRSKVSKRLVIF